MSSKFNWKNVISITKKEYNAGSGIGGVTNFGSRASNTHGTTTGTGNMGVVEGALKLSQMKEHYTSTVSGAGAATKQGGRRRRTRRVRRRSRRTHKK